MTAIHTNGNGHRTHTPTNPDATVYTADLNRTWLGWEWTVRANHHIIGKADGLLALLHRDRAGALNAATRFARHHDQTHGITLDV